jgi:hypothetical protein
MARTSGNGTVNLMMILNDVMGERVGVGETMREFVWSSARGGN